ncbi:hypothetical protein GCM10011335_31270 [Aureimonas glaciei]|uniref:Uncharacterized protein n=1 Tax=Aureimonas glaciei TaxID=1776957 RepID=A0A916Y240_9HYPH|nr:hypothetical protein GCM10011335_31270 [Aureimonas glaciei]
MLTFRPLRRSPGAPGLPRPANLHVTANVRLGHNDRRLAISPPIRDSHGPFPATGVTVTLETPVSSAVSMSCANMRRIQTIGSGWPGSIWEARDGYGRLD